MVLEQLPLPVMKCVHRSVLVSFCFVILTIISLGGIPSSMNEYVQRVFL